MTKICPFHAPATLWLHGHLPGTSFVWNVHVWYEIEKVSNSQTSNFREARAQHLGLVWPFSFLFIFLLSFKLKNNILSNIAKAVRPYEESTLTDIFRTGHNMSQLLAHVRIPFVLTTFRFFSVGAKADWNIWKQARNCALYAFPYTALTFDDLAAYSMGRVICDDYVTILKMYIRYLA